MVTLLHLVSASLKSHNSEQQWVSTGERHSIYTEHHLIKLISLGLYKKKKQQH